MKEAEESSADEGAACLTDLPQRRGWLLPPHWFLLSVAAIVGLSWLTESTGIPYPWGLLGLVPLAFGIWVAVIASGRFAYFGTPIVPFERSTALVTDGPFGYSRNPMYLSMVLALGGIAAATGEAWPWCVVVCFWTLIRLEFIRREEVMMERLFGDQYRAYCQRVRRWL